MVSWNNEQSSMVEQKTGELGLEDLWNLFHELKIEFKLMDKEEMIKGQGCVCVWRHLTELI